MESNSSSGQFTPDLPEQKQAKESTGQSHESTGTTNIEVKLVEGSKAFGNTESAKPISHDSSTGTGSAELSSTSTTSQPPPCSVKRIKHDLKMVMRDPLPGIFVHVDEHDITVAHCLIIGPFDTPYEGGYELTIFEMACIQCNFRVCRLLLFCGTIP